VACAESRDREALAKDQSQWREWACAIQHTKHFVECGGYGCDDDEEDLYNNPAAVADAEWEDRMTAANPDRFNPETYI